MNMRILQIAWRNIGRNKRRTTLALLAIAVGQFALLATSGLMRGYIDNIRSAITGPMVGHIQIHQPDWRQERAVDLVINDVDEAVAQIENDSLVDSAAARIYAPVLIAPGQEAYIATVVGVQVNTESRDFGLLSGYEETLEEAKVLIGYQLARKINVSIGQEIAIVGQAVDGSVANDLYIVQGIVKCPADLVNQTGVVMSLADAQRLFVMPNQAHEITIRVKDSQDIDKCVEQLQQLPILADTEILSWEEILPEFVNMLKISGYVSYYVVVIVFIAAIAGIANTLMMSTFERFHEFGMLLALGSRPRRIVYMIISEAVFIGLIGVVLGTLFGCLFVAGTSQNGIDMAKWGGDGQVDDMAYMGLNLPLLVYPVFTTADIIVGIVAVIITSLIASLWPAWIAGKLEPVEAMRS